MHLQRPWLSVRRGGGAHNEREDAHPMAAAHEVHLGFSLRVACRHFDAKGLHNFGNPGFVVALKHCLKPGNGCVESGAGAGRRAGGRRRECASARGALADLVNLPERLEDKRDK